MGSVGLVYRYSLDFFSARECFPKESSLSVFVFWFPPLFLERLVAPFPKKSKKQKRNDREYQDFSECWY